MKHLVALVAGSLALLPLPSPALAAEGPLVGPGDRMETDAGSCTLNFAYDGLGALAGRVYLGTAAHCVQRIGEPVATDAYPRLGAVAFLGDAEDTAWDFALIEVDPALRGRVRASVQGHPDVPTGFTRAAATAAGDLVQLSGHGGLYEHHELTREQRQAVLADDTAEVWQVAGPLWWGDSGGPLVHVPTGRALGIESRLCFGACTDEGPTVEGLLAKLAARGFPVALRTV